jgi:hypothetical protein
MSEPAVASGQVSQILRGHQADTIDFDGSWIRVRCSDGYEGWCHRGYLAVDSSHTFTSLQSAWRAEQRMSVGCTVRSGEGHVALPLGALLDPDEEVVSGLAMNHRARLRYFASDPDSVATRAVELFHGAPYQWGGVTPWGADCSGFVQTMLALHGTQLPRDAWMQGERGLDVANDLSALRSGDLLFFSDRDDGRPTHVALSLGGAACAHCSLANGGFGVNLLDADDSVATALRDSFRFARRIL